MPNRLIGETSPYLLQHAHNPVDWYPWGEEALERARREDKPILLSIGYSACHWCHVMERESFEDEDIARLMNDNFVCIKVDREERPDLDSVYMQAVHAISGSGGWPLTVFLTPRREPFYGGTYFPPQDRGGLPGFPRVLQTVSHAYRTRREEVAAAAEETVAHLRRSLEIEPASRPLSPDMLDAAYRALVPLFDRRNGGFGSAPKFPQPMILEFLLRHHHRTRDGDALLMVERALQGMARGGICDQVGGGFHRYSTDARWLVPHFEKMLYDNALLARVYLHAWQATGNLDYRRVVEETLDYVLREMRGPDGGFFSTQDADSEGVEGKYYLWTPGEMLGVLGGDGAEIMLRYFGVSERGNFEGGNILTRAMESEALAQDLGVPLDELEARVAAAKARLLRARGERVAPHRDEKVLADWNGLMLAGLAEAASVLEREDYLEAAVANAEFLISRMYDGETLKHSWKDGRAGVDGFLLDYASVGDGLLSLYGATFDGRWLEAAEALAGGVIDMFWDSERGCFFDTALGREQTVVRPRSISDNAVPSGPASATLFLVYLARLLDRGDYEEIAAASMRSAGEAPVRYPFGFGHWLCALDFLVSASIEIAVVGPPNDPATRGLIGAINARYLPDKVLAAKIPGDDSQGADMPLLRDRNMVGGRPTVYVCRDRVCRAPVTDPGELAVELDRIS